jgi:hypothetical protein
MTLLETTYVNFPINFPKIGSFLSHESRMNNILCDPTLNKYSELCKSFKRFEKANDANNDIRNYLL